jgi:hypothetical protein
MPDKCRLCAKMVGEDIIDLQELCVQEKFVKCSLYLEDNKLFPQNICRFLTEFF